MQKHRLLEQALPSLFPFCLTPPLSPLPFLRLPRRLTRTYVRTYARSVTWQPYEKRFLIDHILWVWGSVPRALRARGSPDNIDTVFSRIIAGSDDYFFPQKRSRLFERAIIISNIAHWRSCPKNMFCFIIPLNRKLITSNKENMGLLSVPNLVIWLIFNVNILGTRAWIVTNQFCWIRLHCNLTGRG